MSGRTMLNTPVDRSIAANAMLVCALWSETDSEGQPLEDNYALTDISPEAARRLTGDLFAFLDSEIADLVDLDPTMVGHDFWLTRNHHGSGFWERGLGAAGDRLTAACDMFGEVHLYPGDDGVLHV